MSGVLPLPLTVEGITADWLTAALAERLPGVVVREAQVVDVIQGTSTKIRVRLSCNDLGVTAGVPETLIVKGGFEAQSADGLHVRRGDALLPRAGAAHDPERAALLVRGVRSGQPSVHRHSR